MPPDNPLIWTNGFMQEALFIWKQIHFTYILQYPAAAAAAAALFPDPIPTPLKSGPPPIPAAAHPIPTWFSSNRGWWPAATAAAGWPMWLAVIALL